MISKKIGMVQGRPASDVLWVAWLQVQENGGSGGVDGEELSDYRKRDSQQASS